MFSTAIYLKNATLCGNGLNETLNDFHKYKLDTMTNNKLAEWWIERCSIRSANGVFISHEWKFPGATFLPLRTKLLVDEYLVNPFPNKPWFVLVCSTSFENTVVKREIARNEQFLLFHSIFYQFEELYAIFVIFKIVLFKRFQFERV